MIQIGIDLGGTKIEAAAIDRGGRFVSRRRVSTPRNYDDTIGAISQLVDAAEAEIGASCSVGIGCPGSISPQTGLMRNANAVFLNGRLFKQDLARALGREIRMANDANCLALSEAVDGAAAGARAAFALILGTGCGGGLVVNGSIVEGANGIGGEWGHVPLPWAEPAELPSPECWCGQKGCLELWISGSGLQRDHLKRTGIPADGGNILEAVRRREEGAIATFDAYVHRLGRAIAMLANILDPDAFILGGGMSNVTELYDRLPAIVRRYTFADQWNATIVPAKWGDSSGVRGAARLWPASA